MRVRELVDETRRDLRVALRSLRRTPGFVAVVVLTLALGVGATTAVFSVVHAVLLRPPPYRAPEALVTVSHARRGPGGGRGTAVSAPSFADYRDRARVLTGVAVAAGWSPALTGRGEPERLHGGRVSAAYFATLGVPAALGRTPRPDEDRPGRSQVVVLSDALWRRRFGASPAALGAAVQLDGARYDVVGVMPPGFRDPFAREAELWTPLALAPDQLAGPARTDEWLRLVARLRPGVTVERARAELAALAAQLRREDPGDLPATWTLAVTPLSDLAAGAARPVLLVLLGAVGCVLLVACANVANLLLARAAGRAREVAVRAAVGASRARVARQLLAESLALAGAGGAAGLLLAAGAVRAFAAAAPADLLGADALAGGVGVNGAVLAFTLGVTALTGVLFGVAPAVQASRADVRGVLRAGARGATADRGRQAVRRALVVAQVALALTLLVGAGLLAQSFARLRGVAPGFDPARVLTLTLTLPPATYPRDPQRTAFYDRLLPALAAVPGVRAAGVTSVLPFGGGWYTSALAIEGQPTPADGSGPSGDVRVVSPDFFAALRVPLLRGRVFTARDGPDAPRVAVVDAELARRYWPGGSPIGTRVARRPGPGAPTQWYTVVGVVGHTAHEGLGAAARVQVYLPYAQDGPPPTMAVAVRTAGEPAAAAAAVRRAVAAVDPALPVADVRPLEARVAASLGQRRLTAALLAAFAAAALALAAAGIYGVLSYVVAQRTREIGVRLALGGAPGGVLRLVLRQGVGLAVAGVGVGAVATLGLTRLLESQLYGVRAADPATFGAVALLLVGVAALATLVPALRATRVAPTTALRGE
jgi:putative ABC transport system permease protein